MNKQDRDSAIYWKLELEQMARPDAVRVIQAAHQTDLKCLAAVLGVSTQAENKGELVTAIGNAI